MTKKSRQTFSTEAAIRPNYLVHVSNNVTLSKILYFWSTVGGTHGRPSVHPGCTAQSILTSTGPCWVLGTSRAHSRRTSLGSAGGLAFLEESNPRGKGQSRGYLGAGKRVSFPVNFVSVTEFSSQPLNWWDLWVFSEAASWLIPSFCREWLHCLWQWVGPQWAGPQYFFWWTFDH